MNGHRIMQRWHWTVLGVLLFSFHGFCDSTDVMQSEKLFSMSLRELMNVELEIVTAGKIPEKIAEIPASVVLIGRKDIEINGYRSLAEILEHIPGLFPIDDYSWGGTNFGVRGFWTGVTNRNVIILVNGVNQIGDFESGFPLNKINVPVEAIDRIEVIRGPMSVLYGTGAFFGVINIITNEIKKDCVSLASASVGSRNSLSAMLRVSEKKEDFQYVFNASLSGTDGMDIPLRSLVLNPEMLTLYGLNPESRTTDQLENNEKYIAFSGKSEHFLFDFSFAETQKEIFLSAPSFGDGSLYSSDKINAAFGSESRRNCLRDRRQSFLQAPPF
jgi:outer membrane receptor for ferrienterochelin and colicins